MVSKLYESVLKNRNESELRQNTSDYQTGGVKGKSTVDHMIVLSEILRRNKRLGKKTYVLFGDAVKCFDRLWLKDALVELYKAGFNPQDIQMIYNLNKETEITIDTPQGKTRTVTVKEIVKQGTILGPNLCCIVTDQVNTIGEDQEKMVGKEKLLF